MPAHLDSTVSVTTGTEVKGVQIPETLIASIWPNAGSQQVAQNLRDAMLLTLIWSYHLKNGGLIADAEQYVRSNVTLTD